MTLKHFQLLITLSLILSGCAEKKESNDLLSVVTTTTMITDLVTEIGGDRIKVSGLMGSGVDPHLYKASEGDVNKLYEADLIIYNGLHLEGKLVDIFEKMNERVKKTMAVGEVLDKSTLIGSEYFASNYDPHIWFDTTYWGKVSIAVAEKLGQLDPANKEYYADNATQYQSELQKLDTGIRNKINELEPEQRILVTAHDAFSYFGRQHDFEVVGLQGLSTATEAGVQDVIELTNFIIDRDIKAIFVESSVPKRTVEALQAAANARNHKVTIGGELYSDALGNTGTVEGTYIGMYLHNINTIVDALK